MIKNTQYHSIIKNVISSLLPVFFTGLAFAKPVKTLPFPAISQSFETLEPAIRAITEFQNDFIMLPKDKHFIIKNNRSKDGEEYYRSYNRSKRYPFLSSNHYSNWVGLVPSDEQILLFDGDGLSIKALDIDFKEISEHSITYDRIRAPKDRGGEPTAWENRELNKRFVENLQKRQIDRFVGIASTPKEWFNDKKHMNYLLASKIPGFPLLRMDCEKDIRSRCEITRACIIENIPKDFQNNLTGIAVSSKQKKIVFLDQSKHSVYIVSYHSCFNSVYQSMLALPDKIKKILDVYVDENDRLIITTEIIDDYNNASVYIWPKW